MGEGRWTVERARSWDRERGWRVGCNFTPSTACNALELWQEQSFDPDTLERELGWAADLGFTSIRLFLHDLLWTHERDGFLERLDRVLGMAAERGIGVLPVLFDGVWNPVPTAGPQAEPRPRVHNAGWVQGPGARILGDPKRHDSLRPYVQGVLDRFRDDPRVDGWDLFNEPDNPNPAYTEVEIEAKAQRAVELLAKVFDWAREVDPSQPLTAGVWRGSWRDPSDLSPMNELCLLHSDVVSFHHYGPLDDLEKRVEALRGYDRPLWCTEFMARTASSSFDPHLAWMRDEGIGAFCWGLVAGRTQTHYPWDSWLKRYDAEPDIWFHEILRADGRPWDEDEVAFIRKVTGASEPAAR